MTNNELKDLQILEKVKFDSLEVLYLDLKKENFKIFNLEILSVKKLKILSLINVCIIDIKE